MLFSRLWICTNAWVVDKYRYSFEDFSVFFFVSLFFELVDFSQIFILLFNSFWCWQTNTINTFSITFFLLPAVFIVLLQFTKHFCARIAFHSLCQCDAGEFSEKKKIEKREKNWELLLFLPTNKSSGGKRTQKHWNSKFGYVCFFYFFFFYFPFRWNRIAFCGSIRFYFSTLNHSYNQIY